MNKIQRVTAVVEGRRPDRPPVSFWHHFSPDQVAGPAAVEAHVRHVETYDLDLLKIMNDNGYPRPAAGGGVLARVEDLDRLSVLAGDEDVFGRQLELIGRLSERFAGQLPMTSTIFNSWTTLRNLAAPATRVHAPPTLGREGDQRDAAIAQFLREGPDRLARTLDVIAESLGNFARRCVAAGADGVFLSVRDDRGETLEADPEAYDRLVRPGDLKILAGAIGGTLNMLHVCGKALDFGRFAEYPVHAINWADRYAGPSIADVAASVRPAICAGLDNLGTMLTGSPDDCAVQIADALAQAGDRPIIIAPGCTYDPEAVPRQNLMAIRRAVGA